MKLFALCLITLVLVSPYARADVDHLPLRQWTFGKDIVVIEHVNSGSGFEENLLTIRRDGQLVDAELAQDVDFVTSSPGRADAPKLMAISSVAGRDLVIETYSGGAYCCSAIKIVTFGDDIWVSDIVELREGDAALLKQAGSGRYVLSAVDHSYDYRWTGFLDGSPTPALLLRYDIDTGFSLAGDLMKKPAPSAAHLAQMAAKMQRDPEWKSAPGVSTAYLEVVLDLVYSGNFEAAQDYAVKAWPDGIEGRQEFIDDLNNCMLPSNRWWRDLAALNGIQPHKAGEGCKPD